MVFNKIDKIVELAKIYIEKYHLSKVEAIDCAVRDIEKKERKKYE